MSRKLLALLLAAGILRAEAAVTVNDADGWFESAYVEWTPVEGATGYNVYCQASGSSEWNRLDNELVRCYGTYGRADAVGLAAGTYVLKVVPVYASGEGTSDAALTGELSVRAHNRDGFAHTGYTSGIGAYNDDGTLKDGARVLYVNASTAKTVTLDMVEKAGKAAVTHIGLQSILKAYEKGAETRPLAIRIVGTIEAGDMDSFESKAEGLQIKGKNNNIAMQVTIEGIGRDAGIKGFGILLRNAVSVELRNFAVMLCMDDCISIDTDNRHLWVHNLDLFYGQTGSASDQVKGDGTIDIKADSKYITVSYNHFWDSGKSSLCGMKSESGPNWITYHHNWFDHSDSRHPRIRTMSVHVWNNYFDGNAKYGVGVTTGSCAFVDRNYFRNPYKPMMSSLCGTDATGKGTFSSEKPGFIKAYGNVFAETNTNGLKLLYIPWTKGSMSFDAYEVDAPSERVPATVVDGDATYNNFDTDSTFYSYAADSPADIPAILMGSYGAGRLQHGDFQWTFDNSTEDANDAIIPALKSALNAYTSTLLGYDWSQAVGVTKVAADAAESPMYDLQGRRIQNHTPEGFVIRDGKTLLRK